ncbi:MAG: bifunctional methylenetetrahydrofolate dehydrogenase/methenyltetrahydrofolate cyclohydrolase FolD [Acidobacteria bacterium]|nr:bifunctional methylenetetrahydrofolate dehydrogenase/methenyltetrahydrofolate cyclohydrolase FolD [Acidobacteriota bacterium]
MTAQPFDGNAIAKTIKAEVAEEVQELARTGIQPGLAAVLTGSNPSSHIYVTSKVNTCHQLGIHSEKHELPEETTTEELLELITWLNGRDEIDGILVQLPLPKQIDTVRILESVDPAKDVDGFHPFNVGKLVQNRPTSVPCTPAGIMEMLDRYYVRIEGQRAVVLGRSDIVGKPMALLLMHRHATVTICHSRTPNLAAVAREADILVCAIGRTAIVTADYVKPGAVVIDVGINKLSDRTQVEQIFGQDEKRLGELDKKGYTLIGDVNPKSVSEVAGYLTPVPGGVGPLTIAMLMKNTVEAAKRRRRVGSLKALSDAE